MFSQLTQEPRAKTFFRDKTWSPVQAGRSRCIHHRKHRYQSHLKTRDTPGLSAFPSQMIRDGERTEFIGDLQRVIFCVTGEGPTCTNDGSSAGSYEGSYLAWIMRDVFGATDRQGQKGREIFGEEVGMGHHSQDDFGLYVLKTYFRALQNTMLWSPCIC